MPTLSEEVREIVFPITLEDLADFSHLYRNYIDERSRRNWQLLAKHQIRGLKIGRHLTTRDMPTNIIFPIARSDIGWHNEKTAHNQVLE